MISIITAAYNCQNYISQAIASVQAQTYQDWEMIVVDDVSDDATAAIVERFMATDTRIKLIRSETKLLAAGARNLATQHAERQYITILDGDDFWHENKLEKQLVFMQKYDHAISATAYKKSDAEGKITNRIFEVWPKVGYSDMLTINRIGCLTVMYDTKKLGKLFFDESYQFQEDYLLWVEVLKHKTPLIYGLNEPLAYYRVHSQAKSSNKFRVALYRLEVYKNYFKFPFFKRWYYYLQYLAKGLVKYLR